jgi:fucose permease
MGQYLPFLLALFVVSCGASILKTAANPLWHNSDPPDRSWSCL